MIESGANCSVLMVGSIGGGGVIGGVGIIFGIVVVVEDGYFTS